MDESGGIFPNDYPVCFTVNFIYDHNLHRNLHARHKIPKLDGYSNVATCTRKLSLFCLYPKFLSRIEDDQGVLMAAPKQPSMEPWRFVPETVKV